MSFPIEKFKGLETPFYYYDKQVLTDTLRAIGEQLEVHPNFFLHYAIKANANIDVLKEIQKAGFGVYAGRRRADHP